MIRFDLEETRRNRERENFLLSGETTIKESPFFSFLRLSRPTDRPSRRFLSVHVARSYRSDDENKYMHSNDAVSSRRSLDDVPASPNEIFDRHVSSRHRVSQCKSNDDRASSRELRRDTCHARGGRRKCFGAKIEER